MDAKPANDELKPEKISAIYNRIFSADPLLIDADSQTNYREALLQHLLISRSISASRNKRVNLHAKRERTAFLKRPTPRSCNPSKALKELYADKRRQRETLDPPDFEALAELTMVCRGEFTNRRREEAKKFEDHGKAVDSLQGDTISLIGNRLRIATIGYRVKISRVPNKTYFDEELCVLRKPDAASIKGLPEESGISELGRTQLIGDRRKWEGRIVRYLKQALSRRPHLIMLPEFALPALGNAERSTFNRRLRNICKSDGGDHLLFAGSRHEGPYNRGLIFSKVAGKVCDAWWHYKVASARGLNENIMARFGTKVPTYAMSLDIAKRKVSLAVIVAICYDAFDPTTFLSLMLQSRQTSDGVFSIILVPSFNTSEEFVALLRDLSFLARCVVVYVNGLHGNAKMYAYGVAISDLIEYHHVIQRKVKDKIDELSKRMEEDTERLWRAPQEKKPAIHHPDYSNWSVMRTALKGLKSDLDDWEKSKALTHVITVERGSLDSEAEIADGYVSDDILYYNIDIATLTGLANFRNQFFLNDKFLPSAFHDEVINEAIRRLGFDREDD